MPFRKKKKKKKREMTLPKNDDFFPKIRFFAYVCRGQDSSIWTAGEEEEERPLHLFCCRCCWWW